MRLTKTVLERAKTNAEMTNRGRIIVESKDGHIFDTVDTAHGRRVANGPGYTLLALVSWDGTVDRPKRKKRARRPK